MMRSLKWFSSLLCLATVIAATGCRPADRSPDAIRQDTARATSTAVKDAKAVAKGVADGLKQKGPVNINKASEDDLQTLPGVDSATAQRIVDGRPYGNSSELVKKHIVTRTEYDRIAGQVVAE